MQHRMEMRICKSRSPMPSIHGVSVNKTSTDMVFLVNTTPTNALPMIWDGH